MEALLYFMFCCEYYVLNTQHTLALKATERCLKLC